MKETETDPARYWEQVAFSCDPAWHIVLPSGGRMTMNLGHELRGFIRQEVRHLTGVPGDILDICAGALTRSLFPHSLVGTRRVIGVDLSEQGLHATDTIRPHWDKDFQGALDRAIIANLEEERLRDLGCGDESLAIATMIRSWRYLTIEALGRVVEDVYSLLAPGGVFVVADIIGHLHEEEAVRRVMGELRPFDLNEARGAEELLRMAGFRTEFREINDFECHQFYYVVRGRK